jgi:hypothetical protein
LVGFEISVGIAGFSVGIAALGGIRRLFGWNCRFGWNLQAFRLELRIPRRLTRSQEALGLKSRSWEASVGGRRCCVDVVELPLYYFVLL